MKEHRERVHKGTVGVATLTVSDTRTPETDESGDLLQRILEEEGLRVVRRGIVRDNREEIRRWVLEALDDPQVDLVLTTGGTGVSPRDVTPEALEGLFEKRLPGFAEAFRALSAQSVGPYSILSRAEGGIARGGKPLFLLPGSPSSVKIALSEILLPVLRHLLHVARENP